MDATRYVDPTINRPTIEFTVPGEPVSKSRHRTSVRRGRVSHYADPKNAKAQDFVGVCYRQKRGPGDPAEGGFGVEAKFYVMSRQRRDIDNFIKLVFDGLTGLAWIDDSQVTEVTAKLIHGDGNPRSEIKVYPTEDLPDRLSRVCEQCSTRFRTYESWSTKRYCSNECRSAAKRMKNTRKCAHCGSDYRSASKADRFCSTLCMEVHTRPEIECEYCHSRKRVSRTQASQRNTFCDAECRASYWRDHRTKAAKGTCKDCGGSTSKRQYQRCRSCALTHMRSGQRNTQEKP